MIEQFPLPMPTATVEDITAGPDGAVWFAQETAEGLSSIGRITIGGAITEYALPAETAVGGITEGPDGDLWFTENLISAGTAAIGRITPQGQIKTFALPKKVENNASLGNITIGPDGNLWFPFSYFTSAANTGAIGRITAKGAVKMYVVFSAIESSYGPDAPGDIISGPDGKLWFEGTVRGTTGIGRISTSGKLGPVIPVGGAFGNSIGSNMVRLPDGQVWFEENIYSPVDELGLATRSGVVATQDLPAAIPPFSGGSSITYGSDGSLWATSRASSVVRISGLDTVAGGLDFRHRPKRAPDYVDDQWTNVTASSRPTFAGVAQPGAEVTLWAQKQGESQPVSIGQVKANNSDGSWTLTSHIKLINGNYAVTATQSGDTGPPSVLYSLVPDSSGDLSNALVIQTTDAGKPEVGQRFSHKTNKE